VIPSHVHGTALNGPLTRMLFFPSGTGARRVPDRMISGWPWRSRDQLERRALDGPGAQVALERRDDVGAIVTTPKGFGPLAILALVYWDRDGDQRP
jgi:hypothetical protein